MKPELIAIIATFLATLISAALSLYGIFAHKKAEEEKEISREVRNKKIIVYVDIIEFLAKDIMQKSINNETALTREELIKKKIEIANKLIYWGSNNVIKQYNKTFKVFRGGNIIEMTEALKTLLFLMRTEINPKENDFLNKMDLLRLLIENIDEFVAAQQPTQIQKP